MNKYTSEKRIPYRGDYWWSDSKNVTSILERYIEDVLNRNRVTKIEITGTDFNDGRESRFVSIEVKEFSNEIVIKEEYK